MPTPRQRRVVRRHAGVTLTALLVLAATGTLTLDVAVVASLLSLLVVAQFSAPVYARPAWRARLRWILVVGVVVFLALAARHGYEVASAIADTVDYT